MNNFDFDDDLPFSPAYENDVDNKEKEYQVSNTEEEGTLFTIKENEIFMKIV